MRYNEHGLPCALDEIEVLTKVFSPSKSDDYFIRLKQELPWQELAWDGQHQPKLVCKYGDLEREMHKFDVFEELIQYIEDSFETNVLNGSGDYYRSGKDHTYFKRHLYRAHTITLAFGAPRTIKLLHRDIESYLLNPGNALYLSNDINRRYEYSVPKTKSLNETIYLTFNIEKPYIRRTKHKRYIHVLGVGGVPVWFHGDGQKFPNTIIATMLPSGLSTLIGEENDSHERSLSIDENLL